MPVAARETSTEDAHGASSARPGVATIKDIAAALAVSPSTVSRALSDHRHISAATKERVSRAAAELGYVAHAGARTLRQANSRLIGVIVPNVMNQLFVVMIKVLAERCERAGYQLVLCVTDDDPEAELRHVEALRQSRATGLILVPTPFVLPKTASLIGGIPAVQFSRSHRSVIAPSVAIDGAQGVANAVRHLADLGHARIAYIGLATEISTGEARAHGFVNAMEQRGLSIDARLFNHGPGTIEYGRATTTSLLRRTEPPTAIIYGSADLTQGGLESIRHEGVAVPAQVSLVGFGDPGWFKLMAPALSTVGLSLSESAEAAISMLLRQIEARETGREIEPQTSLELEPFLILRETTAPPRRD